MSKGVMVQIFVYWHKVLDSKIKTLGSGIGWEPILSNSY